MGQYLCKTCIGLKNSEKRLGPGKVVPVKNDNEVVPVLRSKVGITESVDRSKRKQDNKSTKNQKPLHARKISLRKVHVAIEIPDIEHEKNDLDAGQSTESVNGPSGLLKISKSFVNLVGSIRMLGRSREEFTIFPEKDKFKVMVVTWNMNGQIPAEDLNSIFKHASGLVVEGSGTDLESTQCHMVVVGTQECSRSIEQSVLFPNKDLWERLLSTYLPGYSIVKAETLTALHAALFVRTDMKHLVTKVESDKVATGIGNIVGNKGGVGFSMMVEGKRLAFVNCHLTAQQKAIKERNADLRRIDTALKIGSGLKGLRVSARHEYVFFFGDLNYRVNGTRRMVEALLSKNQIEVLLANDQLSLEKTQRRILQGFHESPITFIPTYKFDEIEARKSSDTSRSSIDSLISPTTSLSPSPPSSCTSPALPTSPSSPSSSASPASPASPYLIKSTITDKKKKAPLKKKNNITNSKPELALSKNEFGYDTSAKNRIPSWTDRILYKAPPDTVTCESYKSIMDITCSDHKPVIGIYRFENIEIPITEDDCNGAKAGKSTRPSLCTIQ